MYKKLIGLLYIALLSSCGLFNSRTRKQDIGEDNTSWELIFKLVGGKTSVPLDVLYLDGRIAKHQMFITAANFRVEKKALIVRYKGIGKAKAIEVCNKLEEDKQIEVLVLTLMR